MSLRALVPAARVAFAVGIVAFGVQHFLYGALVTRMVPPWPGEAAAPPVFVYVIGALLIGIGAGLLWPRTARISAVVLGGLLVLSFLGLHLPKILADGMWGGSWTAGGKALVALGGGLAVARSHGPTPTSGPAWLARVDALTPLAAYLLGGFMILCGIQHFVWDEFVATLVPIWVPPGAYFWTYCSGVLLIAGGAGMVLPWTRSLAAALSGLMIFLWVLMLHIPRGLAAPAGQANEWVAVFEALAFSGVALLIAVQAKNTRVAG